MRSPKGCVIAFADLTLGISETKGVVRFCGAPLNSKGVVRFRGAPLNPKGVVQLRVSFAFAERPFLHSVHEERLRVGFKGLSAYEAIPLLDIH